MITSSIGEGEALLENVFIHHCYDPHREDSVMKLIIFGLVTLYATAAVTLYATAAVTISLPTNHTLMNKVKSVATAIIRNEHPLTTGL